MNTKIEYHYTDGDNFKTHGEIVFMGEPSMGIDGAKQIIMSCLTDDNSFIPEQINMDSYRYTVDMDRDHCWHMFDDITLTEEHATDISGRATDEVIAEMEKAGKEGWEEYDILQRYTGKLWITLTEDEQKTIMDVKQKIDKGTPEYSIIAALCVKILQKRKLL